jgi:hypothetical protein
MEIQKKTDILNFLFKNSFNTLTYEEKCQLKSNRPTPNITLEYKEGKFIRKFQYSWYNKFPWLTACDNKAVTGGSRGLDPPKFSKVGTF